MRKRKHNEIHGLSQTSVSVRDGGEGRQTVHRRPVGLTITVKKIDCVLEDGEAQIEHLRQDRIKGGQETNRDTIHPVAALMRRLIVTLVSSSRSIEH